MAKRERPQMSREDPVPLHRSYGVTKREGFFVKLNNVIAATLAVILFSLLGVILFLGVYILVSMLGAIGIMLTIIAAFLFVYLKLCRKLRKRAKLIFRLRRCCKQMGYKLKFHRSFRRALRLNKEGIDFTVNTGKKVWDVRFFTPKKYLSHIIFADSKTIEIKTNITKSNFKFILGLNDPRIKRMEYTFDDPLSCTDMKCQRALIVNPAPHDVFKKDYDGAVIPIGTGERLYGYTLFTGSGFLDNLRRESGE